MDSWLFFGQDFTICRYDCILQVDQALCCKILFLIIIPLFLICGVSYVSHNMVANNIFHIFPFALLLIFSNFLEQQYLAKVSDSDGKGHHPLSKGDDNLACREKELKITDKKLHSLYV